MPDVALKTNVLEVLHSGPAGYRALVRDLAGASPDLPAGALVTALRAAAAEMDAAIRRQGASTDEARMARRLAMLLAIELERAPEGAATTLSAMRDRWAGGDGFLLRL